MKKMSYLEDEYIDGDYSVSIELRRKNKNNFVKQFLITSISEEDGDVLFSKLFDLAIKDNPPGDEDKLKELKMRVMNLSNSQLYSFISWINKGEWK